MRDCRQTILPSALAFKHLTVKTISHPELLNIQYYSAGLSVDRCGFSLTCQNRDVVRSDSVYECGAPDSEGLRFMECIVSHSALCWTLATCLPVTSDNGSRRYHWAGSSQRCGRDLDLS